MTKYKRTLGRVINVYDGYDCVVVVASYYWYFEPFIIKQAFPTDCHSCTGDSVYVYVNSDNKNSSYFVLAS